jgi:hypothetical protein
MPVAQLVGERSQHIDRPWPAGQSYRQVVAQVRGFLHDLAADWDRWTVVVIGHSATKWALDCLLNGMTLEELVDAPFGWQEGWRYLLPATRTGQDHTYGPPRSMSPRVSTALVQRRRPPSALAPRSTAGPVRRSSARVITGYGPLPWPRAAWQSAHFSTVNVPLT